VGYRIAATAKKFENLAQTLQQRYVEMTSYLTSSKIPFTNKDGHLITFITIVIIKGDQCRWSLAKRESLANAKVSARQPFGT